MNRFDSLNDDPMWETAAAITVYAYAQLEHFPEEEEWGMCSTLRRHAFALSDDIAEAAGSHDPRERMHSYGHARQELFGLKNVLTIAKRLRYIEVEPEKMLAIEELIAKIDQQHDNAQKDIKPYLSQFELPEIREKKQ